MTELRTEIALQAPAERVWELLTDLTLYSQWNPLFVRAQGRVTAGERLALTVQLPSIPAFEITPKLLHADRHVRLFWQQTLAVSPLMSWTYGVELEPLLPGRLKLVQRSTFGGLLGPLFDFALKAPVEGGMSQLNRAISRWEEERCGKEGYDS
jgi:hypothetical protein